MPHPPLGRVSLVSNPNVGLQVFETVIMNHMFSIPHNLENEHVTAMREHEAPFFPERTIEFFIYAKGVPKNELICSIGGPIFGPVQRFHE
jgi:hypothetical protein